MKYLDHSGLARLFAKIKALIPTKVSELENDAGYATEPTGISEAPTVFYLGGQALVRWRPIVSATQYRIQRRIGDGVWSTIAYVNTPTYLDKDAPNGGFVSYRVLAYAGGAWTATSPPITGIPIISNGSLLHNTAQSFLGNKTFSGSVFANGATGAASMQQCRNIAAGTDAPTSATCPNGCIYLRYE